MATNQSLNTPTHQTNVESLASYFMGGTDSTPKRSRQDDNYESEAPLKKKSKSSEESSSDESIVFFHEESAVQSYDYSHTHEESSIHLGL